MVSDETTDAAFARFVREQDVALQRTAFLLTGSRIDGEELVQDTLTLLYPKWDRVRRADSELAYVRRALTNRFVSLRRSPAVRDRSAWEIVDAPDGRDIGETVTTTVTMWQLLATLPAKQRAAVVLRYFHDLPDAEGAAWLGCRPSSYRSLVSRGVASLREAYRSSVSTAEEYRR